MTADDVTFGLALIGYALLAAQFARVHAQQATRNLAIVNAAVVAAHVACVWALRFDWSLARMIDKSLSRFMTFHSALLLILMAPAMRGTKCVWITTAAFALVTAGALPAPFRYPELSLLQLPLAAIAAPAIGYVITSKRLQIVSTVPGQKTTNSMTPVGVIEFVVFCPGTVPTIWRWLGRRCSGGRQSASRSS